MIYAHTLDAELLASRGRFITELGLPVLELLNPQPGERILDVGCGDGVICEKLADAGAVAVGIDKSRSMVEAALKRNVDARVMNAEQMTFNNEFDAVYTNSAMHWMRHLDKVIAGVYRALKPGGRFVGETGGKGSVSKIIAAIRETMDRNGIEMENVQSWYFPTADELKALFEKAGFEVKMMDVLLRPTVINGDVRDWVKMFGRHYMDAWDSSQREMFLNTVKEIAEENMVNERGEWVVDYRRVRFQVIKPLG